jgi:hypothetical protein
MLYFFLTLGQYWHGSCKPSFVHNLISQLVSPYLVRINTFGQNPNRTSSYECKWSQCKLIAIIIFRISVTLWTSHDIGLLGDSQTWNLYQTRPLKPSSHFLKCILLIQSPNCIRALNPSTVLPAAHMPMLDLIIISLFIHPTSMAHLSKTSKSVTCPL